MCIAIKIILQISAQCLGKVGTIKLIYPSGDTVIYVCGGLWVFNPLNLTPAPGKVLDGGREGVQATGIPSNNSGTVAKGLKEYHYIALIIHL